MNRSGLIQVLENARTVQDNNPELFAPIEQFFNVDISNRLKDASILEELAYVD
jgi:hypothetical protein